MSMMLMVKAFGVKVGSASSKLVLLKLADNANDQGECWPSYQHIADQCEMSRRSAMVHIDALCDSGFIEKRTRKGPKGNSSNVYIVILSGKEVVSPSADSAPPSEQAAPPSAESAPTPSAESAPGISNSLEPVSEPVSEPLPCASDAAPLDDHGKAPELYSEDFNRFWKAYPSKKNKRTAALKFKKLREKKSTPEFLAFLIEDIECRAKGHEWLKNNGDYIPHAATYLNQERWNDPAPNVSAIQSRHTGFADRDYSEGLIEGVSDNAANF